MSKGHIFIGSSTESKQNAQTIAQHLSEAGFSVMRWWQSIPLGQFTLPRLYDIAKHVDGAIFLFNKDDDVWYRGQKISKARDNVLLEFGIFSAELNLEKCVIVKGKDVILPTDIHGLTYQPDHDITSTSELLANHFIRVLAASVPTPVDEFFLIADPTVIRVQMQDPSSRQWHIRDLYYGVEGAKAWLGLVREPSYAKRDQEQLLKRQIVDAVSGLTFKTIVAFGPGDAIKDKAVALNLARLNGDIHYIPIDICENLLQLAMSELSNIVDVPVGILGDFEERMNFINRQVVNHAKRPILFLLTGNTLGNLDDESKFMVDMYRMMEPSDHLLIDISLASPIWKREDDRRCVHAMYGPMYRRFLAQGISRRTNVSVEKVMNDFESRIMFDSGYSAISDTNVINIIDSMTDQVVYVIRRYTWDKFYNWAEKFGFTIVYKNSIIPSTDSIGDGIILLRKNGAVNPK